MCISVTGIYVRVHVLMFFCCMYLLFVCDCCFYFAIVFSSLNRVFVKPLTPPLGVTAAGAWHSLLPFLLLLLCILSAGEHCRCMHSPNTMCEKYCRAYAVIMTSMHSSITVLLTLILADGCIIIIRASTLKGKLHQAIWNEYLAAYIMFYY